MLLIVFDVTVQAVISINVKCDSKEYYITCGTRKILVAKLMKMPV